jgi:hypothetical protein
MIRAALLILAGIALAFAGPAPAPAQETTTVACFAAEELLATYRARLGEVPVAGGRTRTGVAFYILAAPGGGFTMMFLGPDGYLCPFMSGDGFAFTPTAAAPGDPS